MQKYHREQHQGIAVDAAGGVGGEEDRGDADVPGRLRAAERYLRQHHFRLLVLAVALADQLGRPCQEHGVRGCQDVLPAGAVPTSHPSSNRRSALNRPC